MICFLRDKIDTKERLRLHQAFSLQMEHSAMEHSALLASNRIEKGVIHVSGISVVNQYVWFCHYFCNLLCLSSCLEIKRTSKQPWTMSFFPSVSSSYDIPPVLPVETGRPGEGRSILWDCKTKKVCVFVPIMFITYVDVSKGYLCGDASLL